MIPALHQAPLDPMLRSGRTLQVYVFLCTQLDVHQFRTIKITAYARVLDIKRQHLGRAITLLRERGYIESQPDGDDARRHVYRLVNSVPPMVHNRAA